MLCKKANKICGKPVIKLPPVKGKYGKTLENTEELHGRWKEHFEEIYNIQTDNITAEMLQGGGEHSVKMMHQLCNKIYQEEHVPVNWGKAIIVPLYKKSDKRDCGNYRGISLLSIPSKVFTKVVQQRLKRYVESCLTEEQAGFRPEKSTKDQLFVIRQISKKYFDRNRTLYNNFIDFKQAFDSVWQQGLW